MIYNFQVEIRDNDAKSSLTYYKEVPDEDTLEQERLSRKDKARQRWKILCLVKTSDTVADETARQEKLQERVDEWMSSMVTQMRTVQISPPSTTVPESKDDNNVADSAAVHLKVNGSSGSQRGSDSGRNSPAVVGDREDEERKKAAFELTQRIREREKIEIEKERLLVLEGKLEMTKEHLKDPVIRMHHNLRKLERKAKKQTERKVSSGKAKRKISSKASSAIKMRWSDAMDKMKVKSLLRGAGGAGGDKKSVSFNKGTSNGSGNHSNVNNDEPPAEAETVMASLIYDETKDRLSSAPLDSEIGNGNEDNDNDEGVISDSEETTKTKTKSAAAVPEHANPVFHAFDGAKGVDDLYRIAEIWVNPSTYYHNLD